MLGVGGWGSIPTFLPWRPPLEEASRQRCRSWELQVRLKWWSRGFGWDSACSSPWRRLHLCYCVVGPWVLSGALEDLQPLSFPLCLQIVPSHGEQAPTALPQGPQEQHGTLTNGLCNVSRRCDVTDNQSEVADKNPGLPVAEGRRAPCPAGHLPFPLLTLCTHRFYC